MNMISLYQHFVLTMLCGTSSLHFNDTVYLNSYRRHPYTVDTHIVLEPTHVKECEPHVLEPHKQLEFVNFSCAGKISCRKFNPKRHQKHRQYLSHCPYFLKFTLKELFKVPSSFPHILAFYRPTPGFYTFRTLSEHVEHVKILLW